MTLWSMLLRLGSANVLMLGAHVATLGVLGVIAPPAQFAMYLLALSISQPFSAFAGLRLESAFPAIRAERELRTLLVLAVAATVGVALLQLAIVAGLRRYGLFELDRLEPRSLAILPLLTFAQALVQIGRLWAIRRGRIEAVTKATYFRAANTVVTRGAIIIGMLAPATAARIEPNAVLLLLVAELAIAGVMAAALFPLRGLIDGVSRIRLAVVRATLARNWKFPLLETPSTILDTAAMNAPIFLVTQFYGLGATANFGLAFRGLAVPAAQISRTLTEVLQVRYSEILRRRQMEEAAALFRRSTGILGMAAIFVLISLGIVFAIVHDSIPSARWREFAAIVVIISPWIAASAVVNINSRLLLMLKRQELKLVYDGVSIAFVGALILVHQFYAPHFYIFVALIAGAQVIGYALYWGLIRRSLERHQ